ncbi:peptide-methionine (S)-S-oxide reductase MsrA [Paenibacillus sp. FSL R7-0331]|uniref:peptide-methionine (S)-S-oxide reductase MsrA n=1 Tax=Paenibacillus sp. FSL R7-0331 TaxID=1536773 RepID=UPI0004F5AB21|nr:peptide-methionine (S)-S-oxide reductase MsrA [Paenibacillus sp. FSL R7-0331]AIQ50945.1 methionine sulfoxide reductase [Paenibacillus sp. FSL R7-0331]
MDEFQQAVQRSELATFAGGCFWCMVKPFDELPGIISVVSGYTGGHTEDPTYAEVGTETTGHFEAVQITFEPELFPYRRLLDIYWQLIDPTDRGGQFMDRGHSYKTAIFVHNEAQRMEAEASRAALQAEKRFKGPVVTEILPAKPFYPAEAEHQNYYKTHPLDYKLYLKGSGRSDFTQHYWQRSGDSERLRSKLSALQFEVTQNKGTEPPFDNAYWNVYRDGIYTDLLNGDPLFSSRDKFDSGTGWPSFTRPLEPGLVRREADLNGGKARTVLRSRLSGAYIGLLLYDGPEPAKLHYRVNSAALHFIPKEELEAYGLERYLVIFE